MLLLVPADPLRPTRVDEHFAAEATAARALGVDVAVVDHDALTRPGEADRAVRRVPASDDAVYRGWMLRAEQYQAFADALGRRDVALRCAPEEYRRAHELPGWYAALAAITPVSVWTEGVARADFDRARRELGPGAAVLRDHVKSAKHHWHEAAYLPDLTDADAAWAVAARFQELRGDDLVGGLVLRRFEEFVSREVRTWWVDGVCRLVGPHPDTPDDLPPAGFDPGAEALIAGLRLPFVTADFALRSDGAWRLVELGDGQVSDRPTTVDAADLVTALLR
jgi:hypothetical protein